jgi:hypothetical protein
MPKAASTIQQTRRHRRVPIERRPLPAAPLIQMVHSAARRRREALEELLGPVDGPDRPWLVAALRQAEQTGTVTVLMGEHFCDILGWHPRMVWGDTYDTTISDTTPPTAPAPAGTTSGWRQGCRCLDCREANRAAIARSTRRHHPQGGERPA